MLLGSRTYSGRLMKRSPRQISKIKRDSREISSHLHEIGVAEQEYYVRFCAKSIVKYPKNPQTSQIGDLYNL